MATVKVAVRKCDVCGADGAQPWLIQYPDTRKMEVDLCSADSAELASLGERGRPGRARRSQGSDGIVVSQPKPRKTVAKKATARKK